MRKHGVIIALICSILAGMSGCKKEVPAPEAAPAEAAGADASDTTKPEIDTPPADAAKAEDKSQPVDGAKPALREAVPNPPEMPAFNEESLAKARARAEAKRKDMPCPKGATFKDGTCICPAATGIDADQTPCKLAPEAFPLFSSDFECVPNFWECFQSVMCVNPNGCHTADGVHYGPYYHRGYIVGGIDTAIDTSYRNHRSGLCVLDRTDGIPLFSARKDNNSDFACDQEFCPCASDTCILGEICSAGACAPDNSPLPVLNEDNSTEVAADSLPKRIDGMPQKTFDAGACPGGKHYCHSAGMKPMLEPEGNYDCIIVASLPGIHRSGLRAWVCQDKECPCGETKCKEDEVCLDGSCHRPECHGEGQAVMAQPDDSDYRCMEVASIPGNKRPGLMAWVCGWRYGCHCGDSKCKEGQACIDGKCHKP